MLQVSPSPVPGLGEDPCDQHLDLICKLSLCRAREGAKEAQGLPQSPQEVKDQVQDMVIPRHRSRLACRSTLLGIRHLHACPNLAWRHADGGHGGGT